VRARLALAGIANPMELPSMHVILDTVEQMLRESCQDPIEWERLQTQLYMPDRDDPEQAGWGEQEQLESFDAFMGAVGN
jgi:hypothetical protein